MKFDWWKKYWNKLYQKEVLRYKLFLCSGLLINYTGSAFAEDPNPISSNDKAINDKIDIQTP